jgi:hypothetical protein
MNESEPRKVKEGLRSLWKRPTPRYKAKLEQMPAEANGDDADVESPSPSSPNATDVERLQSLAEHAREEGAAFQSVAVAALQILERVLRYERMAAEAALSLGQREKLQSMVATAEQACTTMQRSLSVQGAKVKELCTSGCGELEEGDPSWWFALTEALDILEKGTEQMASLTTAQPESSPSYDLSRFIARLLRKHHDELLLEAEQWIA